LNGAHLHLQAWNHTETTEGHNIQNWLHLISSSSFISFLWQM
jgi:hypothetical protein